MCAIFGLGLMKGHKLKNNELFKTILSRLFIKSQARGTHASGIAISNYNGIEVFKRDQPASLFIKDKRYEDLIDRLIDFDKYYLPMSILGHCRFKTKGTYRENVNNHPIVRKDVVGVHNGCIGNDDILFDKFSGMFERNGRVDSEIIFALIEYVYNYKKSERMCAAINYSCEILNGSFACAVVHRAHPYAFWLFRRRNPCDVVVFEDVGLIVWASDVDYIKDAVSSCDELGPMERIEMDINSGLGFNLDQRQYKAFSV
jgi:glucosamine 6-phosphate synthetase-like amidotransferase/phosphosugar isomerase protein